MRSQDVFAASKQVNNRFLLCRVAAVSSHRLHIAPAHFSESINRALRKIAEPADPSQVSTVNPGVSV